MWEGEKAPHSPHYYQTSNEKFKKCKKVGIEKKVKKQDGMSTIIVNYSDKIIRR